MANPDSGRKPDEKERKGRLGETNYDLLRVLLAFGTAVFAFSIIVLAVDGQYPFAVADIVPTVLLGYLLYRSGRNRRRPNDQGFPI